MKAGVGLQVATVDFGDWDMHAGPGDVDGGWMVDHLGELVRGARGVRDRPRGRGMSGVTLVTLTEFGRRVEENGSRRPRPRPRQPVLLMGGGVKGGQVHGSWPGLAPGELVDGDLARHDRLPHRARRGAREALRRDRGQRREHLPRPQR